MRWAATGSRRGKLFLGKRMALTVTSSSMSTPIRNRGEDYASLSYLLRTEERCTVNRVWQNMRRHAFSREPNRSSNCDRGGRRFIASEMSDGSSTTGANGELQRNSPDCGQPFRLTRIELRAMLLDKSIASVAQNIVFASGMTCGPLAGLSPVRSAAIE